QDVPAGVFDPLDPRRAFITGIPTQSYDMNLNVSKVNSLGGTASMGVNVIPSRTQGSFQPLNPQTQSSIQLSYTQPLLQGADIRAGQLQSHADCLGSEPLEPGSRSGQHHGVAAGRASCSCLAAFSRPPGCSLAGGREIGRTTPSRLDRAETHPGSRPADAHSG